MSSILVKTVSLLLFWALSSAAAEFRAGVARVDITPAGPIRLSGYASRTHPSEGVITPLYAKALAIEDSKKHRIVIVTTDLVGLPRAITDVVSARLQKEYGLDRAQLLFNCSHTHTGPMIQGNLTTMSELEPTEKQIIADYSLKLTDQLAAVVEGALKDLAPADIWYGVGEAGFAINRREPTATGVKIGLNPKGPVDHTVPVLRVTGANGKLRVVLFGYACHNTTLTGQFYGISGDYAGFAQKTIEDAHPGATAMFFQLCAGDQNPNPRSTLALAQDHGKELAASVEKALAGSLERVRGPVRTAFQVNDVALAPHTRDQFEGLKNDSNVSKRLNAQLMLGAYDGGHPVRSVAYPVQAIRFGKDLAILALGGEVVVDYDLRAKREFPKTKLIVAGYSNDVMCYIPSKRVLQEGGYEAVDSMLYYGQPGPFTPDVEETIFTSIHQVMKRVGL
jgi:neutral ceramidase